MSHINLYEGRGFIVDVPPEERIDGSKHNIRVGVLKRGTFDHVPLIAFGVIIPDERGAEKGIAFAQTSLEAFLNLADEVKRRYGDPRINPLHQG